MKRFIALLLIGILLISGSGCDRAPKDGDDSEVAMSETDDGVDMERDADDSVDMKREADDIVVMEEENNIKVIETVPETEIAQPKQPEIKKEPQSDNLSYTVKHDDSSYIYDGFIKDDMPEFPMVHIIDSTQKLSQVIEDKSASYRFPEKIRYREKKDSTEYDYTKAKQEAAVTEFYNDYFFENKILVIVISKLVDTDIVADLNSVKSDGTVQIDLLNSKSRNYKTYSMSCCEYIELDKKYADLDFKIKYNEVSIETSIDTRSPLPEYPQSVDFKVKHLDIGKCSSKNSIMCSHEITVINSVVDFEYFMVGIRRNHQSDNIKNDIINVYAYNNKFDLVDGKNNVKVDFKKYYNEKFFKTKSIVVVFGCELTVRSVTAGGIITYENYIPIQDRYTDTIDSLYRVSDCDLIEIDKKYENLEFKTEFVEIRDDEYKWKN